MDTEFNTKADQDLQAVQAVRGGDAERYRELVERHERRVFAVAWSRLGDAALAEEAAQEAFIRGYQRLWLLGDGAKFAAWITAIARRVAINCGLRNRRELNKRARWALETPEQTPSDESPDLCPPETMRQALAELPAAHRECLVLFYLEGKSGVEAAAILGITETALRVRLHRARAALREQLEDKLAGSLEKLRPAKTLVPGIMAAILATATSKASAAGTGATVLGILVKFSPLKWAFAFVPMIIAALTALPGLPLAWWLGKVERRNFRGDDSFRAKIHRRFFLSFLWGFPLVLILIHVFVFAGNFALGIKGMFLLLAIPLLFLVASSARLLEINRSRFHCVMFVASLVIGLVLLVIGLGWLPFMPTCIFIPTIMPLALLLVFGDRPARMDYNLFLRASQGMLENSAPPAGKQNFNSSRAGLLAFARFLGERWLINNFRWETRGLVLRLPPANPTFGANFSLFFFPRASRSSQIALGWDGAVTAHYGEADERGMLSRAARELPSSANLATQVAQAATLAWQKFRAGNSMEAERVLGQISESEIFVVPTARSQSTRWWRWFMIGSLLLSLIAVAMILFHPANAPSKEIFKPVSVSEQEIRASLAILAEPGAAGSTALRDANAALYFRYVLPRRSEDFTLAAWKALRADLLKDIATAMVKPTHSASPVEKVTRLMYTPALQSAIINGWLKAEDFGLTTEEIRRDLSSATIWERKTWFEISVQEVVNPDRTLADYTMLDVRNFARRMQCLQQWDCLQVVDGRKAVETLAQHQMPSTTTPPGRRKVLFPEEWHGLFLTLGSDPITETYDALKVLELFGSLDQIDREACVEGILRFHHGKGLFRPLHDKDDLALYGVAQDTFCAFESLRILGALDRVPDLKKWQFRPMLASKIEAPGKTRSVWWDEIEALILQQRLDRDLRDLKENPRAVPRSLLE